MICFDGNLPRRMTFACTRLNSTSARFSHEVNRPECGPSSERRASRLEDAGTATGTFPIKGHRDDEHPARVPLPPWCLNGVKESG